MDPSLPTGLPPVRPSPGESFFRLGRLVRKELSEILRDRRTIITLVLMPLLLYPLLSVGFQQFASLSPVDPKRGPEYHFGFASEREGEAFDRMLEHAGQFEEHPPDNKNVANGFVPSAPRWKIFTADDLDKSLREGTIHLAIRVAHVPKETDAEQRDVTLAYEIQYL